MENNNKLKLKKLQLPGTSRSKSNNNICNSQISKFFSNASQEDRGNAAKTENSSSTENIISLLSDTNSDDEKNSKSDIKDSLLSSNNVISIEKIQDKTESINKSPIPVDSSRNLKRQLQLCNGNNSNINESTYCKTKISKFFEETLGDDSFETLYSPPKVLKKTLNCEPKVDTKRRKTKAAPKTRKRRNIKNAFHKNEEIFSDIMAKHSIEDNFNPDDVQMALALSLSEKNIIVDNEDTGDSVTCTVENVNNIKERLKKFGFEKVEKKDYDLALYLPTLGKKKTKWANRFSSLTLREPNKQMEKLKNNIKMFLDSQELEINSNFENTYSYETESPFLQSLQRLQTGYEFMKHSKLVNEIKDLDEFYITELFKPGKNKVDSLLKKFEKIPGRDLSPPGTSNKVISKLEDCDYGSKTKTTELAEQHHTQNIILPFDPLEQHTLLETGDCISSMHQSNKNENIINCSREEINKIDAIPMNFLKSPNGVIFNFSTPSPNKNNCDINFKESPDLFADSDPEIDPKSICDLTHFEKFSSDDVKILDAEVKTEKNISEAGLLHLNDSCKRSDNEFEISQGFDFNKSDSFSQSNNSGDCIILSEDEIEYSIMMSNKKQIINRKIDDDIDEKNFSFVEFIQYDEEVNTSPKCNQDLSLIKNYSTCSYVLNNQKNDISLNKISSSNSDKQIYLSGSFKPSDKQISSPKSKYENKISRQSIKCKKSLSYSFEKTAKKHKNTEHLFSPQGKKEIMFSEKDMDSISVASNDYDNDEFDLSKLRKKFGITKTPGKFKDYGKLRKTLTDTSLPNKKTNSLKGYSSANKFSEFIGISDDESDKIINGSPDESLELEITKTTGKFQDYGKLRKTLTDTRIANKNKGSLSKYSSANKFSEFIDVSDDEFDKMINGSPAKSLGFNKPENFDVLLTGAINETRDIELNSPNKTIFSVHKKTEKEFLEYNFENRTYLIKTTEIEKKPDYNFWNSTQLENELNKYGLKSLRKKQAVLMLDYIYNQMHPIIIENAAASIPDFENDNKVVYEPEEFKKSLNYNKMGKYEKIPLKDCFGQKLLEN